ncbi:MAG: HD domain-containing phosphohydrolase [Tistlia sp.]|uniref:HD domain-containing phosphohydrolase n=1 Tax=Tistlia sp. TaxID=3057121 RepID=UPI0034A13E71
MALAAQTPPTGPSHDAPGVAPSESEAAPQEAAGQGGPDWRPWSVGLLLLLAALAGVYWVFGFVEAQRQQELRVWQDRLALVAESRAAAVDEWLRGQRAEIAGLADNASLRLLLSELALAGGDLAAVTDLEGQRGYIDNLLTVTAERAGYAERSSQPAVGANLPSTVHAGLAALDADGRLVVATSAFETGPVGGAAPRPNPAPSFRLDPEAGLRLRLVAPIYALQGEAAPGREVGWLVAQRPAGERLRGLLRQPGLPAAGLETWLLRRQGAAVEYLLEAAGAAGGLLAADTPELAGAAALAEPGGFGIRRGRDGGELLATSRRLAEAPLSLMVSVERAVALSESEARLGRLLTLLLLAIGLVGAGMAVLWRHGASRRARAAALAYRRTAQALAEQRDLLRLVTDSQPTAITILDEAGCYRFANRTAGLRAGLDSADLLGKELTAVLGPAAAQRTLALAAQARDSGQPVSDSLRIEPAQAEATGTEATGAEATGAEAAEQRRVYASDHIPVPRSAALGTAVLVVERDLTVEFRERARRERALNDLVEALVRLVDRRDPFAADHSQKVGRLAQRLAREMGLSEGDRETARIAGLLMNVGKIAVPEDVLTRKGGLSAEERRLVRDSLGASAELLQGIEFDGPVAETLRQAREGAGTESAGARATLAPARILAVANAFVGMVSDRAWRDRLGVDEAIAEIMAGIGTRYDRGAAAALVGYLDNKGGRADWERSGA